MTTSGQVAIYFLVDPRQPELVRYVGQSATPRVRHLQHCAETCASRKGHWIESLRMQGLMPQMLIVEWVIAEEAAERERMQIAAHLGVYLMNTAKGVPAPRLERIPEEPSPEPATIPKLLTVGTLASTRRAAIQLALKACKNNKREASLRLGIGRQTLYNLIKKYSLD